MSHERVVGGLFDLFDFVFWHEKGVLNKLLLQNGIFGGVGVSSQGFKELENLWSR